MLNLKDNINQMIVNLKETTQKNAEQDWLKTNLAKFTSMLQGQRDPDVPWQTAFTLAERLESQDVRITLVKDGDHRLSRPQDIALLCETVAALLEAQLLP